MNATTAEQPHPDLFDVCARKHGGNPESVAANPEPEKKNGDREKVFVWIQGAGVRGRTCEEVADLMGTTQNAISGRITELKGDSVRGLPIRIQKTGTRPTRSGSKAGVYVALK